MKIIGVTGGVGAGKSTVLDYLKETYHAHLILADLVGHEVMEPGLPAYDAIIETFGREILSEDQTNDRKKLGDIVFHKEEMRQKLNAIVHPAVKQEILRRIEQAKLENVSYTVVEAALFLEENYDAFCDETWYIYTSEDNRRLRLKASRGYSDEKIDRMFAAQKSHKEFLERCQFVIDNNGSAEETHRQIDRRMRHT